MSKGSFKGFLNMLAYVALILVAFCLLLQLILSAVGVDAAVVNAMRIVGEAIAYTVLACYGFFFVKNKRNTWLTVTYAVAVTAIVILIIFR